MINKKYNWIEDIIKKEIESNTTYGDDYFDWVIEKIAIKIGLEMDKRHIEELDKLLNGFRGKYEKKRINTICVRQSVGTKE